MCLQKSDELGVFIVFRPEIEKRSSGLIVDVFVFRMAVKEGTGRVLGTEVIVFG
jgi:hypothetical protein